MKRLLASILLLIYSALAFAQVRGTIPREYISRPATDLVHEGKVLLPEEAHQLFLDSRRRLDLSKLNPVQDTDLWRDQYPARIDEEVLDDLPVGELDLVDYDSNVSSRTGIYRFNISKVNQNGVPELFTMVISKNIHSMLLTKALLRKIGYNVPPMKWLPQVRLRFSDEDEKRRFINHLETEALAGDAENWIVEDYGDNTILLQDVLLTEGLPLIYNLAMGPITNDLIGGRRVLSSLVVPLALTNVPESVNLLRWNMGNVVDNAVSVQLDYADIFDCSWEDARWITRRIERLSRGDWEDIAESSKVPRAVQMVLVEKLISRRNDLMQLMQIDAVQMSVTSDLNSGADIVDGKVIRERWDGYATRFAYGDPDSPLSDAEMTSWIKSKALQTFIDGAVSYVNSLPFLGTDIDSLNAANYEKYLNEYIRTQTLDATGDAIHTPFKAWVFPTFQGSVVLSRSITTGAYLGTDGMVNLVDAIGVSMDAGVYVGTAGLPTPIAVVGRASANVTRTYAHLRPVTTLSKALKYPFKNMLVPLVKRRYGEQLNEVLNLDTTELSEGERENRIKAILAPFKKDLEIGESLIITDSIVVGGSIRASAGTDYLVKAQLGVAPQQLVIGRFHIHRRSEDIIQIYRDFGNVQSVTVSFALNSLLPVIKASYKISGGSARTKFFSLSLDPKKPETVANIAALRQALMSSSLKKLEKLQKPWVLRHEFAERERRVGIFFWRWNRVRAHTNMKITHPVGAERHFFRAYNGQTSGRDFQEYTIEAVRNWLSLFAEFDYNSTNSSNNPGQSYKGSARNKILVYEGETDAQGQAIQRPFMRLSRIWNGWEISKQRAQDILDDIRHRYAFQFYLPTVLNDSLKIFLYSISVNVLVYERGVNAMAQLPDDQVRRIFSRHAMRADLRIRPANEREDLTRANEFLEQRRKWLRAQAANSNTDASRFAMAALSEAEEKLNLEGLRALLGGEQNFYVTSRIDGYRSADENGDRAIISNSFGEYGSRDVLGPLQTLVQQTEMLEGEFFIYWLMTRLI